MPFEAVIRNERDALEAELEQPIEGEPIEQFDDPMPEAQAGQAAQEPRPAQGPEISTRTSTETPTLVLDGR